MSTLIKLLFVDDEAEFVTYMTKHLERHNISVAAFTDPVKALEAAKTESYEVGLLDLKMPNMDGEELLKELKQLDPTMEIIILSGHGGIDSAFRLGRQGAYELLQKPCDFDELIDSINTAFSKRLKALDASSSEKVEAVMADRSNSTPLAILARLKRIGDGMTASALAESGDREGALEVLKDK